MLFLQIILTLLLGIFLFAAFVALLVTHSALAYQAGKQAASDIVRPARRARRATHRARRRRRRGGYERRYRRAEYRVLECGVPFWIEYGNSGRSMGEPVLAEWQHDTRYVAGKPVSIN